MYDRRKEFRDLTTCVLLLIVAIGCHGCGLLARQSAITEIKFPATEVGTPAGEIIIKNIGRLGGSLASSDGRLTLVVPPDALAEPIDFSIQPLTNKFETGLGLSYKLGPEGQIFDTPLDVSFHYDDQDLQGTFPAELSIAYQDPQGAWHGQTAIELDENEKTITFSTTHFSVFDLIYRHRLSPEKATVRVGESLKLLTTNCNPVSSLFSSLPLADCYKGWHSDDKWELIGEGKITGEFPFMVYTAPGKKPTPNVATVVLSHKSQLVTVAVPCSPDHPSFINLKTGKVTPPKCFKQVPGPDSRKSVITIVDRGYRAKGQKGDVVFSGVICDVHKPFTIRASWLTPFDMKYDPGAGTWSFSSGYAMLAYSGSGTFTIEGEGTDHPRLAVLGTETITHPYGGKTTSGGDNSIELIPLETDECK